LTMPVLVLMLQSNGNNFYISDNIS
jgi:hypothetical protein